MKIGLIAHDAHPICEPFQGGLEMITQLLVEELIVRGHEVTTLCKKGSQLSGKLIYYPCPERDIKIKKSSNELIEFGVFNKAANYFMSGNFDIIHNFSLSHHAIILGSLCAKPFITSFHTPVFENLNIAINAVSSHPNQTFTAVSKSLSSFYEEHIMEVLTIYNGIKLDNWNVSLFKKNYYSWCGRICKEKGLWETMDLCHENSIKLKFAGPISDEGYFDEFILPRLKVYDNCEYVGHLKHESINRLLANSRAFIFSSTWEEPYGLVVAEALASGTPVVANDIGAVGEIIDEKSGTLFNLKNPETFSLALHKSENLKSEDCRMRAEEFCSHHKMVTAYEDLYSIMVEPKLVQL